jgi:hypothetical protein
MSLETELIIYQRKIPIQAFWVIDLLRIASETYACSKPVQFQQIFCPVLRMSSGVIVQAFLVLCDLSYVSVWLRSGSKWSIEMVRFLVKLNKGLYEKVKS